MRRRSGDGESPVRRGATTRNVYTIPAGSPFLDALAAGILHRCRDDPMALSAALVLLPTRRGCRALADAFLRQSKGRPLLLPRIQPLGDVDEDELVLGGGEDELTADVTLPPAMPTIRRQLLLSRLILAGPRPATTADQAARLAAELARLLDQVQTEGIEFTGLEGLVPDRLAAHWLRTVEFLTVVTEHWPRILAEEGCLDPAERRNRLLRAQAQAWRTSPPSTAVIAAGSTGSVPATADLLAAIATLPAGAVVLPGLDREADDDTWQALEPTHPQYGMARLLERIGIGRHAVEPWPTPVPEDTPPARAALINLALRPAATTRRCANAVPVSSPALHGVSRIDAPSPEEEARAIALIMRHTLETPGKTAALVTPDRNLATRVQSELGRWGLKVDDSGGRPLAQIQTVAFLRLIALVVASHFAPVPLLATLKHPLAAGGLAPARFRAHVRHLERVVLRGPRPAPGLAGLLAALTEAETARRPPSDPTRRTREARDPDQDHPQVHRQDQPQEHPQNHPQNHPQDQPQDHAKPPGEGPGGDPDSGFAPLHQLVADLDRQLAPFTSVFARTHASLSDLVTGHVEAAERLATSDERSGRTRLWAGEAGEAAASFVSDLSEACDAFPALPPSSYPAVLDALLVGRVVRPRYGRHPRLVIWGPLEARMQRADVMILGGLNEGTWPPVVHASPWMSRPMMAAFGLPLPERRVGLSAHDFAQAFCAPEVVLTRAARVEGAPAVESRWLLRLDNLIAASGAARSLQDEGRGGAAPWLAWQRLLDAGDDPRPAEPPAPCPPVEARPRRLSATWIEKWMRDPYAVYARFVLRLRALDPIDADPGAAEYGTFVHRALDQFLRETEGPLPPDALDRLLAVGRRVIGRQFDRPGVRAFWWPRFERIARWFVALEADRRPDILATATEVPGSLSLAAPAGPFTLTATADRIDTRADGGLVLVDYKTGALPTDKEVIAGFAPQLPLEAAMAEAGGFAAVSPAAVRQLEYWRLTGGRPPGRRSALKGDPVELAGEALAGLHALVGRFDLPETPYPSRPRPSAAPRYSDYEHLARVKEWSAVGTDEGD